MISEKKLESQLLDRVAPELDALIAQSEIEYKVKKPPKKKSTVNIQAKLDRLKDLYVDGLIDKAQYCADREKLIQSVQQQDVEQKRPDYSALRELLGKDFKTCYSVLSATEQRAIWRTIIDHIEIDANRNLRLFFKA